MVKSVNVEDLEQVVRSTKACEKNKEKKYLTKLKKLVPLPRNKKVTELELIQNAIKYINDLQWVLECKNPAFRGHFICEDKENASRAFESFEGVRDSVMLDKEDEEQDYILQQIERSDARSPTPPSPRSPSL